MTESLMDTLGIPYRLLGDESGQVEQCVDELLALARAELRPVGLIVAKGTFASGDGEVPESADYEMTREYALGIVASCLGETDVVVSTTGKLSRELYEYRLRAGGDSGRDFLTVGSMGHASQIAMGIALAKANRQVFCLDGDGALLMHMGAVAVIGAAGVANFKHVVFNNCAHDSVGGMATAAGMMSLAGVAQACCYCRAQRVDRSEDLPAAIAELRAARGPAMLEIMIRKGARADLGRPKASPKQNKLAFMKFLSQ